MLNDFNSNSSAPWVRSFRRLAIEVAQLGASVDIPIIPFQDWRLPLFSALSPDQQAAAVHKLERSLAIYKEVVAHATAGDNPGTSTWRALSMLDLMPPGDFFDKITSGDVVHIYNAEGVHIYANLKFFELVSYSMEQVYCTPWDQLWYRDKDVIEKLFGYVAQTLAPEQKDTLCLLGNDHRIKETQSLFLFEVDYRLKYMAPTFDRKTQKKAGLVVIEDGRVLSTLPSKAEQMKSIEALILNTPGLD
jgi:hypothetical protein